MRIAFLYPRIAPHDALANWVATLARFSRKHVIYQARTVGATEKAEVVFVLTHGEHYERKWVNMDLWTLGLDKKPFGVVHNEDNPGVPGLGRYPSFVWTKQAQHRLADYYPRLLRQPVLLPMMEARERPLHLGTFGRLEPKKHVLEMAKWARDFAHVPFTAFGVREWAKEYSSYIDALRHYCEVVLYPWKSNIEEQAAYFERVSHFLFVLPPSKGGTGGSPTSPRYATAFNRPIVVVDDEDTFELDDFLVRPTLTDISHDDLETARLPSTHWGPDEYLNALIQGVSNG
jgi:hypothetical protein